MHRTTDDLAGVSISRERKMMEEKIRVLSAVTRIGEDP